MNNEYFVVSPLECLTVVVSVSWVVVDVRDDTTTAKFV